MTTPGLIELAGDWTLTDETGEWTCPMAVPGDGITALHRAGLIPDPYWGRNEYGLRWVAERDWTIRRTFTLAATQMALVLDGLDTVAEVQVNGHNVLPFQRVSNSFRSTKVLLDGVSRVGENEIAITFRSAPKEAARLASEQPFPVPYIAQNNPIPHGNMLRKPACDWGWDWNIALVPFGVTGSIRLEPGWGSAIRRVMVEQHHADRGVLVEVTLWGTRDQPYEFIFLGQVRRGVIPAEGAICARFHVPDPALWWPVGLGPQTLHDLVIKVGGWEQHRRIGLRHIELVTEANGQGRSFGFKVNGRHVFAKGANWIPADALSGRITEAGTRDLLDSAVAANMNMIRVWGGGRYEPDSFYDACDELGLMVWQDFMFSCNLYPSTPDFLREVDAEVRENVARLHHHACIALWCGDNELVGALTWFPESRKDRDRYLVSYDRLNRAIETALRDTAPDANWWPSSPSPGPMDFGDAWHDDSKGDMHFWSVWHEGRDFDHYRDVSPRFCSEFGFQSYPSMDVIRRFADPKDHNIAAPVLESHQKNAGGNARIAETMFRYFRWPQKFADFVYLSQIQQGLAIKTAVTHWRSLKPHCMGTLIWQLNDTWPVCSWSSLDHGGGWKLLHHMARDFFGPEMVTAVPQGAAIILRAVNDRAEAVALEIDTYAVAMTGAVRFLGAHSVRVGPDAAVEVTSLPSGMLGADEILSFSWRQAGGAVAGDIHAPKPWKAYDLLPSGLSQTAIQDGAVWKIEVAAQSLSLFATLESSVPGRFSDNAFHLFPGYPATITFTPQDPGHAPVFTLRDLYTATTA